MSAPSAPPGPLTLPPAISREFLLQKGCCPLEIDPRGALVVAVAHTIRDDTLRQIADLYGCAVSVRRVAPDALPVLVERIATRSAPTSGGHPPAGDGAELGWEARDLATQAPVVRFLNLLIRDAVDARASDVHLESTRGGVVARYRVDGVLTPALAPPPDVAPGVISRVKLLADGCSRECRTRGTMGWWT
ncbi:MAG: hypothetical protein RQ745_13490 [Longimicrobiales bacterium]|nr:hypothetical protein [Longimicrobiales bacterium]